MRRPMLLDGPVHRIGDRPGRILAVVGAALALMLMLAALVFPAFGTGSGSVLTFGLWLLAGYAVVGAAVALTVTLRASKSHHRRPVVPRA
ncbi:MAG: hypothetical protein P1U88_20395 [Thalassobaculaceae bacterium]|nr:hypothetical protein [Thalassobaculaceae bacterium]